MYLGVEKAKQVAEKARIEAKGIADAVTIEADAKAKANTLIAKSLTNQLIQLEQVHVQGKFNEAQTILDKLRDEPANESQDFEKLVQGSLSPAMSYWEFAN